MRDENGRRLEAIFLQDFFREKAGLVHKNLGFKSFNRRLDVF